MQPRSSANLLVLRFAAVLAILIGAMLVAVQMRLQIFAGKPLGPEYVALPGWIYPIMAGAAGAGVGLIRLLERTPPLSRWKPARSQFAALVFALGASFLATAFLLPDVSLLQLTYYVMNGLVLGFLTILWPASVRRSPRGDSLPEHLKRLWHHRVLLRIWVRYNVQSRYSQTILGILWIVLLPLATSLVFAFLFSQIVRVDAGGVPFITFFLAALVPWGLFSQGIVTGTGSVLNMMSLINQVYFPREILVIVKLGEALVDLTFTFAAMLIINAANGIWPNAAFIYLPLLLAIQAALTLGLMFFISYLSVLVRDVPQLVNVILQLLFYLTPIIYPLQQIPERYRGLALLNPLAALIQAYRGIIAYGQPPDLISLHYPLVAAAALLYTGYMFFKANEGQLADFI
jgi:lipopolysaccharide transport system permease protein